MLDLESGQTTALITSPFADQGARFSPDGRWMAYQSSESGQEEIYVVDLPERREKHAVSLGQGVTPAWTRDGREIVFYSPGRGMMSVRTRIDGRFTADPPELLFPVEAREYEGEAALDVSADGQLFIVAQALDATSEGPLVVRTGWRALLDD